MHKLPGKGGVQGEEEKVARMKILKAGEVTGNKDNASRAKDWRGKRVQNKGEARKKSEGKCRVRTPQQNGERRSRLQGKQNIKAWEHKTEK